MDQSAQKELYHFNRFQTNLLSLYHSVATSEKIHLGYQLLLFCSNLYFNCWNWIDRLQHLGLSLDVYLFRCNALLKIFALLDFDLGLSFILRNLHIFSMQLWILLDCSSERVSLETVRHLVIFLIFGRRLSI